MLKFYFLKDTLRFEIKLIFKYKSIKAFYIYKRFFLVKSIDYIFNFSFDEK